MPLTIATSAVAVDRELSQDHDAFPSRLRTNNGIWMRWAAVVLVAAVLALGRDGVATEPTGKTRLGAI